MYDTKNTSIKKNKNNENQIKHININEEKINIKPLQKKNNNQYDKNGKPFVFNNQNHIESMNIINKNENYKNIILNNMFTPNKKLLLNEKNSSRNKKNIKIERNILLDNHNNNKNFRTIGINKQKSINKNSALKVILNNQEQDNPNDIEMKYKLILYEKNNLINKLKSEVEYYKNFYHNINMNMNIILPNSNNNNTIEANSNNRVSLGVNDKKSNAGENVRNKIKNIFTIPKREIKVDNNHILQHKINDYNTIKTFVNKINDDNINYHSSEATKDFIPQIKTNFNTIENSNVNNNNTNKLNNNKLLLSNDSLKNDILLINKNSIENSNTKTLNNLFYRSNSNTIYKKGRKLKLGYQQSDLNLDINYNNFNSIEANRNYNNSIKNKRHIIYSLNILNSKAGSDNELDNHYNNNNNGIISIEDNSIQQFNNNKNNLNNLSSSPISLYKNTYNNNSNNLIEENNSTNLLTKNKCETFKYKEKFETLKQRMNTLVNNLFDLIEIQNKKCIKIEK